MATPAEPPTPEPAHMPLPIQHVTAFFKRWFWTRPKNLVEGSFNLLFFIVKVLLALIVLLVIYVMYRLFKMFVDLHTFRYQRNNNSDVAAYAHDYYGHLARSMMDVYQGYHTLQSFPSLTTLDPAMMTAVGRFVDAVGVAVSNVKNCVGTAPECTIFASYMLSNAGAMGFPVVQCDPKAKDVMATSILGTNPQGPGKVVLPPSSSFFYFMCAALEQEYLESLNDDFKTTDARSTDAVFKNLYGSPNPTSSQYNSPVDALTKPNANGLSVFGKALQAYVALSALTAHADATAFLQLVPLSYFTNGDISNDIFRVGESASKADFMTTFLDPQIDKFVAVVNVELIALAASGGSGAGFFNSVKASWASIKGAVKEGGLPEAEIMSDGDVELLRKKIESGDTSGAMAMISGKGVIVSTDQMYTLIEMATIYANFDEIKAMLARCSAVRMSIKEGGAKAFDAFARLKINCGVAAIFMEDFDFPPTMVPYWPRNMFKFYMKMWENSWVDYGKNVGAMWVQFGKKFKSSFQHYPEMAKQWGKKYVPKLNTSGGLLKSIYSLSPLYMGKKEHLSIPGISDLVGGLKTIAMVFKSIGSFFGSLPAFAVNIHNFIIGLLVLVLWVLGYIVLMLLSPFLLVIANFAFPVILALAVTFAALWLYIVASIIIFCVGLLDSIVFQGTLAYNFKKWFGCHRIPTDWFTQSFTQVGNYFRRLEVGPFCAGCVQPCKGSMVPVKDMFGHIECVAKSDKRVANSKRWLFPAAIMRMYLGMSTSGGDVDYMTVDVEHHTTLAMTICGYSGLLSGVARGMEDMCHPALCAPGTKNPVCAKYLGRRFENPFASFDVNALKAYSPTQLELVLFVVCIVITAVVLLLYIFKNKSLISATIKEAMEAAKEGVQAATKAKQGVEETGGGIFNKVEGMKQGATNKG